MIVQEGRCDVVATKQRWRALGSVLSEAPKSPSPVTHTPSTIACIPADASVGALAHADRSLGRVDDRLEHGRSVPTESVSIERAWAAK